METEGSELADPTEGGTGENVGETAGDEQRGGPAVDEPVPVAGGALGGRADPLAGAVGRQDSGGGEAGSLPASDEGLREEDVPDRGGPTGTTSAGIGGAGGGTTSDPGRQNPIVPGERELGGEDPPGR